VPSFQEQSAKLSIITQDLNAGTIDPITGQTSCVQPLIFPSTPSDCSWKLGTGTRGQTSTIFYMNNTRFFVGQEICSSQVLQSMVFQIFGPYCSDQDNSAINVRPLYKIDPSVKLEDLNICWDHTCNVVVLQPQYEPTSITVHTLQVSEYDAQVRPRPDYLVESTGDCEDCWRKVPGLGALDSGLWASSGTAEWNCGDSCVFYTLEEHLQNGQAVAPRALIGRYYRTGILAVNLTDSLQAQTLSWQPWNQRLQNQFLGIGICCIQAWCHPDCQPLNGHMVLFSYDSNQRQFSVLSDISYIVDQDTVRMGVEFSTVYSSNPQAYVYHQHTIYSFNLTVTGGVITGAKLVNQSPPSDQPLSSWGTGLSF